MQFKKPLFWDNKKISFWSILLFPLSILYFIIFRIIRILSIFRNHDNPQTIICVGNIYLGGTGKTSFAIELKKILEEKKLRVCFIKKYYSDQLDKQKLLDNLGKTIVDESRLKALKKDI